MEKKPFKKALLTVLALLLAFSCAACRGEPYDPNKGNGGDYGEFVDDIPLEELRGTEAEVTIINDGALNVGAGYTDVTLPGRAAVIKDEYSKSPSIAVPYLFTKQLHNYNVVNNNIRLNYLDWGWGEPLMQRSTSAFLAGVGTDILIGETQMPGYAASGYLKPFPDELADRVRATMLPASYKAMEIDGKIYGLAANPSICVLLWNKDVLAATDVDPKYLEQAPATWDEFLEVCETVRVNGKGKYFAGGVYAGDNYGGYLRIEPFIKMAGGRFADENGRPAFNSAGNADALEFLRSMASFNLNGALCTKNEDTMYSQFNRDKYAYLIDGSWRVNMCMETGMNIGFGNLPSVTGDQTNNIAIGAAYLSVPYYVSDPTNAFKVIESHMATAAQEVIAERGIRPTSRMDVGDREEYATINPVQQKAYEVLKNAEIGYLPSFTNNATKIWATFGEALVNATISDTAINTLLSFAQTEALKLV